MPEHIGKMRASDWNNRACMDKEELQPQPITFADAADFIDTNHNDDNWFLHVETFDPHEPFFTQQNYKDLYPHDYVGLHFDWPAYTNVEETKDEVEHCRLEYAALVSMCDVYLGKVLDMMDKYDLWKDTMLIVNTDHGFLLGEHNSWAKNRWPWYEELSHVPLFIWDPRCGCAGERRKALVQNIDLGPTLLEYFEIDRTKDMIGVPLRETVANDKPIRDSLLFGTFGGHVNCTDGRYVYMRSAVSDDNQPLYDYTLMPTTMRDFFELGKIAEAELIDEPFSFTKGCPLLKIPGEEWANGGLAFGNLLFDLKEDPEQKNPINDPKIEQMMIDKMLRLMEENEAPEEQYLRIGLPVPSAAAS